MSQTERLSPSVFKIPTDKLRSGYYTDRYFLRTAEVLRAIRYSSKVGYQFFVRKDAVACGLDEAIGILKTCAGEYRFPSQAEAAYKKLRFVQWKLQDASFHQMQKVIHKWEKERSRIRQKLNALWQPGWKHLKVYALTDGAPVKKNEPVLAIEGNPRLFVHLETPLLGVLARPTSTATAVSKVVKAAQGKQILFFSARFDHYWVQATDGYAALKAGAFGVSTDANADYWGVESLGTIPHFLIGCFQGNTAESFISFDRHIPESVNRIALVDWENDCIGTTLALIRRLIQEKYGFIAAAENNYIHYVPKVIGEGKGKLWGVRFDTSGTLRDRSVTSKAKASYGVCAELVQKARRKFNRWGADKLKIIVSGGFDEERIRRFEAKRVPADIYGVGSSLLRQRIEVTADIVEFDCQPCAKVGRKKLSWKRLKKVS